MNSPTTNRFESRPPGDDDYHEEWLSAYLDGELTPEQQQLVEQRVAEDPQVAQLLAELERVRGLVATLPAWPGGPLPWSPASLAHRSDSPPPALPGEAQAAGNGDFHAELRENLPPGPTRASPAVAARPTASSRDTLRPRRWPRLLALAASVILMLGLGLMLWPEAIPWSVAQLDLPAERDEEQAAGQANAPSAAPAATADRRHDAPPDEPAAAPTSPAAAAAPTAEASRAKALASEALASETPPAEAKFEGLPAAPPMRRSPAEAAGAAGAAGAGTPELPTASSEQYYFRDSSADSALAADSPRPEATAPGQAEPAAASPAPQLMTPQLMSWQVARSPAWSERELAAGWPRIAALVSAHRSLAVGGPPPAADAAESQQLAFASGFHPHSYPVAVVTTAEAASDRQSLAGNWLPVDELSLTEVAPPVALSGTLPLVRLDQPTEQQAVTRVLFVDRGQARQILQAAEQAGVLTSPPLWIHPADAPDTTGDDRQKVALLFAPQ